MTQSQTSESRLSIILIGLLFGAFVVMSWDAAGNDLRSLWLAASFNESGPSGVYAATIGAFKMQPPDAWIDVTNAEGLTNPVYPYIYPPIWAALLSPLTDIISFDVFRSIINVVNAAMIAGMLFLSWRIVGQPSPAIFLGTGLVIAFSSIVFLLPQDEAQPQILVSFLILLAIERDRADRPIIAGIAMAFAAAFKLYPAIFAIFWLIGGRRTSFASFFVSGGLLGLASIAVSGWPMHQAFLHEISAISRTALLSLANYSLDPLLAILVIGDQNMTRVTTEATGGATQWLIHEKSILWQAFSSLALIVAVVGLGLLARISKFRDPLFWPLAFIVISWLSPLSWLYHYMTAFFFLPVFLFRFGTLQGAILIVLIIAPTILSAHSLLFALFGTSKSIVLATNISLILAALGFFVAFRQGSGTKPA